MSFVIANIIDMVDKYGEPDISAALSVFSCPLNKEIEDFIKTKAIDFARKKLSVTYLIYDDAYNELVGYFTLAHKAIEIQKEKVSSRVEKRIQRFVPFDEANNSYTISAFLLAQFGKNYAVDGGGRIDGDVLMDLADAVTFDIQHRIGGGFIYLDVLAKNDKVVNFYHDHCRYVAFSERISNGEKYTQMIRSI